MQKKLRTEELSSTAALTRAVCPWWELLHGFPLCGDARWVCGVKQGDNGWLDQGE